MPPPLPVPPSLLLCCAYLYREGRKSADWLDLCSQSPHFLKNVCGSEDLTKGLLVHAGQALYSWATSPAHVFLFCFVCFWDKILLCSPGWLQFVSLLPQPPECWKYRHVTQSCPTKRNSWKVECKLNMILNVLLNMYWYVLIKKGKAKGLQRCSAIKSTSCS